MRLVCQHMFFSTLCTTLLHNLIKENMIEFTERSFKREGSICLACNDRDAFFTPEEHNRYTLWSFQKVCVKPSLFFCTAYIKFNTK